MKKDARPRLNAWSNRCGRAANAAATAVRIGLCCTLILIRASGNAGCSGGRSRLKRAAIQCICKHRSGGNMNENNEDQQKLHIKVDVLRIGLQMSKNQGLPFLLRSDFGRLLEHMLYMRSRAGGMIVLRCPVQERSTPPYDLRRGCLFQFRAIRELNQKHRSKREENSR
jgi:hypothetical protein